MATPTCSAAGSVPFMRRTLGFSLLIAASGCLPPGATWQVAGRAQTVILINPVFFYYISPPIWPVTVHIPAERLTPIVEDGEPRLIVCYPHANALFAFPWPQQGPRRCSFEYRCISTRTGQR